MKKNKTLLIIVIIILVLSIFIYANNDKTVRVTLKLPYMILSDGYVTEYDFGVRIDNLEVIESIGNTEISIIDNKLVLNCNSNISKAVLINPEQFSMFDSPLYINNATVKFDVKDKDKEKLIESLNKHFDTPEINKLTVDSKTIDIHIYEPFTGIKSSQRFIYKDFEKTIDYLNNDLEKYIKESELKFLNNNKDLTEFTKELIKDYETIDEKALAIANWVFNNTDSYNNGESSAEKNSIDHVWKNRKAVCKGRAFLIKQMLNIAGIKSEIVNGYIAENGIGHTVPAYYNDKGERCLINDVATDNLTFIENQYINLY